MVLLVEASEASIVIVAAQVVVAAPVAVAVTVAVAVAVAVSVAAATAAAAAAAVAGALSLPLLPSRRRFFQWLPTQQHPATLWHTLVSKPRLQHNASEFLRLVQLRSLKDNQVGTWEARSSHPRSGSGWSTFVATSYTYCFCLRVCKSDPTMLEQWSSQAYRHGLKGLPSLKALQIAFFNDKGLQHVGKLAAPWEGAGKL